MYVLITQTHTLSCIEYTPFICMSSEEVLSSVDAEVEGK